MVKKVFKYGTGQEVPEGAIYLCTKAQTEIGVNGSQKGCWLVWHYFLVEVKE